nr:GYD domain-containing protein [Paraburkholderia sp.]
MATYVILSRLAPDAFTDPGELKQLAATVAEKIRAECPAVTWKDSYLTLGRFDVLDVVESNDLKQLELGGFNHPRLWTRRHGDLAGNAVERLHRGAVAQIDGSGPMRRNAPGQGLFTLITGLRWPPEGPSARSATR